MKQLITYILFSLPLFALSQKHVLPVNADSTISDYENAECGDTLVVPAAYLKGVTLNNLYYTCYTGIGITFERPEGSYPISINGAEMRLENGRIDGYDSVTVINIDSDYTVKPEPRNQVIIAAGTLKINWPKVLPDSFHVKIVQPVKDGTVTTGKNLYFLNGKYRRVLRGVLEVRYKGSKNKLYILSREDKWK